MNECYYDIIVLLNLICSFNSFSSKGSINLNNSIYLYKLKNIINLMNLMNSTD